MGLQTLAVKDGPAVRALAAHSFSTVWGLSDYEYFLKHPQGYNLGIFDDRGDLLAYLLGLLVLGELDLISLATEPKARKGGLASQLLQKSLSEPAIETVHLEVRNDNEPAIALYKKHGFVQTGLRRKYYDGLHDALVLRYRRPA